MKKVAVAGFSILIFMAASCEIDLEEDIVGTWKRSLSYGTDTLVFESDGTFTKKIDERPGLFLDPNFHSGTYEFQGSTLTMTTENIFFGEIVIWTYEITITLDTFLSMSDESDTSTYIRVR